jgi:MinD superfamily P-loop ATPase
MRPLLYVDFERCQGCGHCQARPICRTRAIVQPDRGDAPLIEVDRCMGCLVCVPACPHEAIRVRDRVVDSGGS